MKEQQLSKKCLTPDEKGVIIDFKNSEFLFENFYIIKEMTYV